MALICVSSVCRGISVDKNIALFAGVTLVPVALLALGGVIGGVWIAGALIYLTLFKFTVDELAPFGEAGATSSPALRSANALSVTLVVAHFALLALAVWTISGQRTLGPVERLVAFAAFGLFFGQVSNSNAHELIHRPQRWLFRLGKWVFISHLFGHHASAHRLVHHRFVATGKDPNSAPLGLGFYRFAHLAWRGSYRHGLLAENQRRQGATKPGPHPYPEYMSGAALMLFLAFLIGGAGGVAALVGLAGHATVQLLLSDYVQHYGLVRPIQANGEPEPVAPRHSWNAPHRFSDLLTLNAPRHSDHYGHPARGFPALAIDHNSPTLPHSLAVMGAIALFPPHWRRVMDPRVAAVLAARGP